MGKKADKYPEKIDDFFKNKEKVKYKKDQLIAAPGRQYNLFYLKKGFINQYTSGKNGQILHLQVYKPGSIISFSWLFPEKKESNFYFAALVDCEVIIAPIEEFSEFLKKDGQLVYFLTTRLVDGLAGFLKRFETLMTDNACAKVSSLLFYFGKSFGRKKDGKILIPMHLTHREIASWIGTTRETASIMVESFKKKGILEYNGRKMLIKDLNALEHCCAHPRAIRVLNSQSTS